MREADWGLPLDCGELGSAMSCGREEATSAEAQLQSGGARMETQLSTSQTDHDKF